MNQSNQPNKVRTELTTKTPRLVKLSLFFLFLAIILVYIFSAFKFLYIWAIEANPGPTNIFNRDAIYGFLEQIWFTYMIGRYIFIFIIIGIFLFALILLSLINYSDQRDDRESKTEILIIHDDIVQMKLKSKIRDDLNTVKERTLENNRIYTLNELFNQRGLISKLFKLIKCLLPIVIFLIFWIWFRGAKVAPPSLYFEDYLYTDEASFFIDIVMFYFILVYILLTPNFVKHFSHTGFKRIYLKKWHIHESFIGLLLSIGAFLLLMNGAGAGAYFERMCGIFMLILGMFMIGRDWKDFVQGKFLRD
ncbi:MAG: hypothetical protein GF364_18940 [Candidatus Lokiarchaeota archaeon]|nr:hypothetical protein [Candidatus Lokiarchaeota archaeon]